MPCLTSKKTIKENSFSLKSYSYSVFSKNKIAMANYKIKIVQKYKRYGKIDLFRFAYRLLQKNCDFILTLPDEVKT
jgi:RNase P subunit RPR2